MIRFGSKQVKVDRIAEVAISDQAVNRLAKAIQIPTISRSTHIDTSAFVGFIAYLNSNFPKTHRLLERKTINDYSLIYKWAGKNSVLKPALFLAHIDVVPVEESLSQWKHPPFSGTVEDGYIYGRGTLDDKSSLVGIMEAIEQLIGEGYRPERTIYLAFGHDEEIGGRNGAKAIAQYFDKKHLEFEYVLDEGSLVLTKGMPGISKPIGLIGIAEKGYATVKLSAKTEGGHSSMPPAQTAIGTLSKAITTLEENPMPASFDGPTGMLMDYAGPEASIPIRMALANRWLFGGLLKKQFAKKPTTNAIMRTTTAVTMIDGGIQENVLPTQASATLNFRIRPGDDIKTVENHIKNTINNELISIKTDRSSRNPSKISDDKAFGFRVIQRTLQEIFPDVVVAPSLVVAGTDSKHYQQVAVNTYRLLPFQLGTDELDRIHGVDERISIENYTRAVRFYHQLIKNSCE